MTGPDSPPRSPAGGGDGDARSGSTGVSPNDGASMHILSTAQILTQPLLSHLRDTNVNETSINSIEAEYPLPVPMAPTATPVKVSNITMISNDEQNEELDSESNSNDSKDMKIKLETLRSIDKNTTLDMDSHMNQHRKNILSSHRSMMVTSDLLRLIPGENEITAKDLLSMDDKSDLLKDNVSDNVSPDMRNQANQQNYSTTPKTWSQQDMENALNALRNHNMSLTKASATFGIPSTTLWQRAHRLGIDTPKKEGPSKSWSEGNLHSALQALRTGTISANKASKAYGIPSSTLYKIARREGIRLAAPFNAAPTAWRPGDLERALHSIRSGHSSVQRASTEYGIPTGTLYGRCKREGIELSRSNPTPWSEDAMGEALEAVRVGQMSINQAAIHYNLPYSSLYGRFKRCKYEGEFGNIIDPNVQQNQHSESHLSHQMSTHSTLSAHIGNQDHQLLGHENSRQMYSLYHHHSHSLGIPLELHDHQMESHNGNHSTQDCIPIS